MIQKTKRKLKHYLYDLLDRVYVPFDKQYIFRGKNILQIPHKKNRRGGKLSYAEWAHVIGIFQTLMFVHLGQRENNQIVDIGCGTGLLGIASKPFLGENGCFVGIDVIKRDIEFCRKHYTSSKYSFIHFDVSNAAYAPEQRKGILPWSLESNRFDLVTALSVWTHFQEKDALFYIGEVSRVLKSGGKAIITFFLLDDAYERTLSTRTHKKGEFHMTEQIRWIFDQPAYGSDAWFCPRWVNVPEEAIGITKEGFERLIRETDLSVITHYQGNWKEIPGVFFQDVVVFQKT